jgi:hypothetical protein
MGIIIYVGMPMTPPEPWVRFCFFETVLHLVCVFRKILC